MTRKVVLDMSRKIVSGKVVSNTRPFSFLGRVPFDQKFRFELPKCLYVEWSGFCLHYTTEHTKQSLEAWARGQPGLCALY